VQFGVIQTLTDAGMTATLPVRNPTAGIDETSQSVSVRFRPNAAGVVDIQRLERDLAAKGGAGADSTLDSAEYAMQLIRFPYRQIYGQPDTPRPNTDVVLRPTVRYLTLATALFQDGVTPP
jgi:hypothetical protein